MITLYDNVCTPCVRKQMYRDIKKKCSLLRINLVRKDISKDPEARHNAESVYNLSVPFIVTDYAGAMTVEEFLL